MANLAQPVKNVQVVAEKQLPENKTTIKGRVNMNLDIALSIKTPLRGLDDIATLTAGGSVENLGKADGMKLNYGVQLDLNV